MKLSHHRIVDTHAHLCDPVFDTDRSAVIKRARAAGVGAIITVGEDLSDARRNIELNENHPELKPAAGLYPTCLDLKKAQEMSSPKKKPVRLTCINESRACETSGLDPFPRFVVKASRLKTNWFR